MIERPRLARLLDDAGGKVLTVLEAPAGWGKTVLLSTWAANGVHQGRVGWLAAEPGDAGDLFWRYLAAGLRAAIPNPVDGHRDPTPVDLANAVARLPESVTMIVDDLAATDQGLWADLDYLLRHTAGRLHLIVATRARPPVALHRWGLKGELTEIGNTDLAFTPEETADVIARRGLSLPFANLCDLQRRTEGWPAGVWLAASRIKELPANARRVGHPGGDDPQIGDYFLTEVLADQPDDVRETLMAASILDRMSSPVLEAVTGRADGERLLADLARCGTFLTPLHGAPSWYRLNPLFGEVLRAELRRRYPTRIAGLHARAALWFAEEELAADALRHALDSRDRQIVTRVLGQHWYRLVPSGHWGPVAIDAAAPPCTAVREDPEVALAYAASRLQLHDCEGAEAYLRLASRQSDRVPAASRDRFTMMTEVFRLSQAQLRGDVPAIATIAGGIVTAVQRRTGLPVEYDDAAAAIALTALGTTHLLRGDLSRAETRFCDGARYAVAARLACEGLVAQSRLAFTLALRGELDAAHRTASVALESAWCPGQTEPVHCAHAYAALALVALHRGQLHEAQSNVDLAADLWNHAYEPATTPTIALVSAGVLLERGEWARCHEALLAARRCVPASGVTEYLGQLLAAAEADLLTTRGEPGVAHDLLLPLLAESPAGSALRVSYARACLRNRDPRAAASAVAPWTDDARADQQQPHLRLAAGLLHAEAARELGDSTTASASLEQVLVLAEPEGFRQVFTGVSTPGRELLLAHLDSGTAHWSFLAELLDAHDRRDRAAGAPDALPEPLTERELTILRYLQSLLSNVEIAAELCVSVNTVKTHVRNIYRKLCASHRRDAVRRARELQLL